MLIPHSPDGSDDLWGSFAVHPTSIEIMDANLWPRKQEELIVVVHICVFSGSAKVGTREPAVRSGLTTGTFA